MKAAGHQAFFAGGCVRDLLLGRVPKDFDVATGAVPDQVTALFPGSGLVGAHFGVVLVREGVQQLEVATFRSDGSYRDGRRPDSVRYETNPREDVLRRDFTINSLLLDPENGEVLDYTGGRADLASGVIRTVGDPVRRFEEDHLRLLRAVRFAARFGFRIEPKTFEAIRLLAPSIERVSVERVREEMKRILTEGGAKQGVELLISTGLMQQVLPDVVPPASLLLKKIDLNDPTPTLAWGVLFADTMPASAHHAMVRLRFSTDDRRQVLAMLASQPKFAEAKSMTEGQLKRFVRHPHFSEHLELCRLRGDESYGFVKARWENFCAAELHPPPLLTGDDLIALGYERGPSFSRILNALEDEQLENRIATRDQAIAFLQSNAVIFD